VRAAEAPPGTPDNPQLRTHSDAAVSEAFSPPLAFEKNQGQFDPDTQFVVRTTAYQAFLTRQEAVIVFAADDHRTTKTASRESDPDRLPGAEQVVRIQFERSSSESRISGEGELFKSSYFVGSESFAAVPNYTAVRYASIYPGIDLRYHGSAPLRFASRSRTKISLASTCRLKLGIRSTEIGSASCWADTTSTSHSSSTRS
jgi:hypothetical protein